MGADLNEVRERVRFALGDATAVCRGLGLDKGAKRQAGGLVIRCPWHEDRNPSCSVQERNGKVLANCFTCQAQGDVFDLVAAANGLDTKAHFPEVLAHAAQLAGMHQEADAIRNGKPVQVSPAPTPRGGLPAGDPKPERTYPSDAAAFWEACPPLGDDAEACGYLASRKLDPAAIAELNLARSLPSKLPRWARYQGQSWADTGHRVVLPVFDAAGQLRSVRVMRVLDNETPKRLPPSGHKAGGLVLANRAALTLLAGDTTPLRIVIAEGEPDFLAGSLQWPGLRVFGVGSGAWTPEHAARIPDKTRVIIRTHNDQAGDKYAAEIAKTLSARCDVQRAYR